MFLGRTKVCFIYLLRGVGVGALHQSNRLTLCIEQCGPSHCSQIPSHNYRAEESDALCGCKRNTLSLLHDQGRLSHIPVTQLYLLLGGDKLSLRFWLAIILTSIFPQNALTVILTKMKDLRWKTLPRWASRLALPFNVPRGLLCCRNNISKTRTSRQACLWNIVMGPF